MSTFQAFSPKTGEPYGAAIHEWSKLEVDQVITSAHNVQGAFSSTSPTARALAMNAIADAIEVVRPLLIESACAESGLPEGRIAGEVTRTVVQIKLFADLVATGDHFKAVIDLADPNYSPAPRADLRKQNQALGTVAIFAASNFPLAFSVAGGDSASALAAGNCVVVKAHPSHPNTSAIVAEAVRSGLKSVGLPQEIFAVVQGENPEITHWLAEHPDISAVGFTGSGKVGKILIDIASNRSIPIPVFAEMGSLNPVFVTSSAILERGVELAKASVDSALLGSGQFCTKPGIFFIPSGEAGEIFVADIEKYLSTLSSGPLLNKGIADRYNQSISHLAKDGALKVISGQANEAGYGVTPTLFITDWMSVASNKELLEEHFGPTAIVIYADESEFVGIASQIEGQLTATIQGSESDSVSELLAKLSEKAGRVIWNGFSTGVAVTAAMQHGGQWPASSSHTTSVGLDSLYRFVRPVAYQNLPDSALPPALQKSNPWKIERIINGVRSKL